MLRRDVAMTGNIVAKHDDDVGLQRIGMRDDRLDMRERHPGIAGVHVGDGGDLQLEIGGPLRRRDLIARDAEPQHRLDAEAIGRGGEARGAEAGDESAGNDGVKSWS